MLISQAEMEKRLKSQNNLANKLKAAQVPGVTSSNERAPQVPHDSSIRKIAGVLASIDKPSVVSRELGLTPGQVRTAAHSKKQSVREAVQETKDRVSELALNQLLGTLGLLTPDSMVGEKPKDIANVAASLSKVVSNMTPKETRDSANIQVVIYAPPQKSEDNYKTLDV